MVIERKTKLYVFLFRFRLVLSAKTETKNYFSPASTPVFWFRVQWTRPTQPVNELDSSDVIVLLFYIFWETRQIILLFNSVLVYSK